MSVWVDVCARVIGVYRDWRVLSPWKASRENGPVKELAADEMPRARPATHDSWRAHASPGCITALVNCGPAREHALVSAANCATHKLRHHFCWNKRHANYPKIDLFFKWFPLTFIFVKWHKPYLSCLINKTLDNIANLNQIEINYIYNKKMVRKL